jgi:hypothetical protein
LPDPGVRLQVPELAPYFGIVPLALVPIGAVHQSVTD